MLEKTGVRFPSSKALDIWAANGATVDYETQIVKAPGRLIESALKLGAPGVYPGCQTIRNKIYIMDGNHVFVGTDGCGVEVIDLYTGDRRRSALQDVADIATVADHLPEIAFHWVAVSAQDRPT